MEATNNNQKNDTNCAFLHSLMHGPDRTGPALHVCMYVCMYVWWCIYYLLLLTAGVVSRHTALRLSFLPAFKQGTFIVIFLHTAVQCMQCAAPRLRCTALHCKCLPALPCPALHCTALHRDCSFAALHALHRLLHWANEWVSESVSQWVSESVSEWVSEWVSQWVSESVSQAASQPFLVGWFVSLVGWSKG